MIIMKIKKEIADILKLISPSDLGRATGHSRQLVNAQLRVENLEADSLVKYAKLFGCSISSLYCNEENWAIYPVPFYKWLERNKNILPGSCYNAHGKIRLKPAMELWHEERGINNGDNISDKW
jgi:hypothetical protein